MTIHTELQNSELGIRNSRVVILLIFIHLLIAVPLAQILNIWADEASTLYTTQFGFLHAFQHTLADEKQAPLYFWFLSLWREINGSIFFARFFSIICSCVAIKVFNDLAGRVFGHGMAIAATAFFALHPYLIWASLEIRVYALVVLLTAALLRLFDAVFLEDERSDKKRQNVLLLFFTLLAVIALYTNYYLGFLLVAFFVTLIVLRKRRAAGLYLASMLVAGLAFLPLILAVKSQFAVNTGGYQHEKSLAEVLRILWGFLLTFSLPTEIFTTDITSAISIIRLWIVRLAIAALIFLLIKNRRLPSKKTIIFGTISSVITAFLFTAYYLLGSDYVGIRHAAALFAPFVLFIFLILQESFGVNTERQRDRETRRQRDRKGDAESSVQVVSGLSAPHLPVSSTSLLLFSSTLLLFFWFVVLCFFAYSIYSLYPNLTKRGDWSRIATYLEQNERPEQPIIIFTTFDALALPYYYRGANQILPDEKFFDFDIEAETGSADSWRKQTDFIISEIPPAATEIWLLTNEKCAVKDACLPLENFVQSNYTVIQEKNFNSETVRLLRKK